MIALFIMMMAVLALSAIAAYTIHSAAQSSLIMSQSQRNAAELDIAVALLRQSVLIVDPSTGVAHVPMGEPADPGNPASRTTIPASVAGSAMAPWGVRFAYCPYAPVEGGLGGASEATVRDGAGGGYDVKTVAGFGSSGALSYVVQGARAAHTGDEPDAPSVLAFVIAPAINRQDVPACADIVWRGGAWRVAGAVPGSVKAVSSLDLSDGMGPGASASMTRFVSPAGSGNGLSGATPASFPAALAEWRLYRPLAMTIRLAPGAYDLETADLAFGTLGQDSFGRTLKFIGSGSGSTITTIQAGLNRWLSFPVDTTLTHVRISGGSGLEAGAGVRLLLDDVAAQSVRTNGGTLILQPGTALTSPSGAGDSPVTVTDGDLMIRPGGSVSVNAVASGKPPFRLRGARVRVGGGLAVNTLASSLFDMEQSQVTVTGTGSITRNGANVDPSTIPMTSATQMEATGTLKAGRAVLGLSLATQNCAAGYECLAYCPAGSLAVSAQCASSEAGLPSFLGSSILEDRTGVRCGWNVVGAMPASSVATALCAPLE